MDENLQGGGVAAETASAGDERSALGAGRPLALDLTKKDIARRLAGVGMSRRKIARIIGVGEATLRREMERDEVFRQSMESAESEALAGHVRTIEFAAQKSWRAAVWLLERMWPEEFGKHRKPDEDKDWAMKKAVETVLRVRGLKPPDGDWLREE